MVVVVKRSPPLSGVDVMGAVSPLSDTNQQHGLDAACLPACFGRQGGQMTVGSRILLR
jgi:hypothetical protein